MLRIITLLEERNYYLEKFSKINEKELRLFNMNNFTGIDPFYETRERVLKIIQYIESELSKAEQNLDSRTQPNSAEKSKIQSCLNLKQRYINIIMEQDLEILSQIENYKSQIIKELQEVRSARKGVAGYKQATRSRVDRQA